MATPTLDPSSVNLLLPVLPLRDVSLFPEASLAVTVSRPGLLKAVDVAARTGRRLLALAQRDPAVVTPTARDLHPLGTIAEVSEDVAQEDGSRKIELDGLRRGRVLTLLGTDAFVAEVEALDEGDPGDEWGAAVEALARYLHTHADLRAFLDRQRRSKEPMAWVNLACQHLPITSTARQKLLDSDAASRCLKIGRGLDALVRKEKGD
ncbi:MAG: LON peptidase substrate-binding domain-containing protein [Acidobacteria bacterium]|nr:LON peptidase substrate-binding domain-containing protein [Acidobacteriota bacterium]